MELITINLKMGKYSIQMTQEFDDFTGYGHYQYAIFDKNKNNILTVGSSGVNGLSGKINKDLALEALNTRLHQKGLK